MPRRRVCVLLALALAPLAACGGGTGLPGGDGCVTTEGSQGTMSADVNGNEWEGCIVTASDTAGGADRRVGVFGTAYSGTETSTMTLTLVTNGTGEYDLTGGDNSLVFAGLSGSGNSADYSTPSTDDGVGTVTVTRIDDDGWAGTFSATLTNVDDDTDTIEITGGEFDVSFGEAP